MRNLGLHFMIILSSFIASVALADIVLAPGEEIRIGEEIISCSGDDRNVTSVVDIECMKYLHETNNTNVPHLALFKDWLDSCRNISLKHPVTPRSCTVVGGSINRDCLAYARSLYPGVNSHIVMEFQLECKDVELSCRGF